MDFLMALSPSGRAFACTGIISVLPTLVLFMIPITKGQGLNRSLHKVLLGFAAGGLMGDVFLHSIPHLLDPHHHGHGDEEHEHHDHDHHDEHDHEEHDHGHDHDHHGHDHDHDHGRHLLSEHDHHDHDHDHDHHDKHGHDEHSHDHATFIGLAILLGFLIFFIIEKLLRTNDAGHDHGHSHDGSAKKKDDDKKDEKGFRLDAGGYLNLAADSLHNFTDGIAIGASFVGGKNMGIATTLSVLVHELPHEIGDFAILIQNGAKPAQAIGLQFCTAFFAFAGTALGLTSANYDNMSEFLLALVSGGFVYVATMTVLPELQVGKSSLGQIFLEVSAFSAGVGMMVIVAALE